MIKKYSSREEQQLIFVFFNGKSPDDLAAFLHDPLTVLSAETIQRRARLGINHDEADVRVSPDFVKTVAGISPIIATSRWLNGVAVLASLEQISAISSLSCVSHIESFVRNMNPVGTPPTRHNRYGLQPETKEFSYCYDSVITGDEDFRLQLEQLNLHKLHEAGFQGKGITVAVIDTWFQSAQPGGSPVFEQLWDNGQIKDQYNFVNRSNDIFSMDEQSRHGARVLSVLGGSYEGASPKESLKGAALDASYLLYLTDDTKDVPEEEIFWIEAAERADRAGADIINSSLVYHSFNDDRYNYTYENMDSKTSFIARGAQIASDKGIIVVNGAGNDGTRPWKFIGTPADNEAVFTVGGVDCQGAPYEASSYGPNATGHTKPDVAAKGLYVFGAYTIDELPVYYGNTGTSFSAPLVAGGIACLLQAVAKNTSRSLIKKVLRETARLPDKRNAEQLGYGIIDFEAAFNILLRK